MKLFWMTLFGNNIGRFKSLKKVFYILYCAFFKVFHGFGWLLATAIAVLVIYGPYTSSSYTWGEKEHLIYGIFFRFAWAVSVSWVIYACQNGFGGKYVLMLSDSEQLITQPAITCSKLTIKTLEQRCEICSKLTIKTPKLQSVYLRCWSSSNCSSNFLLEPTTQDKKSLPGKKLNIN